MKIHLLPSQRSFDQAPNESLLDAALRAGVSLNYGCHSGSCGQCVARVVSGQVARIAHSDAVLPEHERARGSIFLCCYAATSDATLEVAETGNSADIPLQHLETRVRKLEPLTPQVLLLHLRASRSASLQFLAGQRARLDFGHGLVRELPIASCPCDNLNLQFHLFNTDVELWARAQQLKGNEVIALDGPAGNFTFDDQSRRAAVFIAWGGGFAPIKSLLEHALSLDLGLPVFLFWLASDGQHYLHNYGRALADALDNVRYTPLPVRAQAPIPIAEYANTLLQEFGAAADVDVYLAGPRVETELLKAELILRGVLKERIRQEETT